MSAADEVSRATSGPRVAAPLAREPDIGVRPYYVTRGRTRATRPLGIEALVETTERGRAHLADLRFERRDIALVCTSPVSVAEVAARVRVPLGVARVLVADLAAESYVQVHDGPNRVQDDISLIQRLIHGVREL